MPFLRHPTNEETDLTAGSMNKCGWQSSWMRDKGLDYFCVCYISPDYKLKSLYHLVQSPDDNPRFLRAVMTIRLSSNKSISHATPQNLEMVNRIFPHHSKQTAPKVLNICISFMFCNYITSNAYIKNIHRIFIRDVND